MPAPFGQSCACDCSFRVPNLFVDMERGFSMSDGVGALGDAIEHETLVEERVGLSPLVAYFVGNLKVLVVEADCSAQIIEGVTNNSKIAERAAFALSVTDLASHDEPTFIKLQGLLRVAQREIGVAEIAQGIAFAAAVFD